MTSVRPAWRMVLLPALFMAELVCMALLFQILTPVECRLTAVPLACRGLRAGALGLLCVAGAGAIYLFAMQDARRELADMVRKTRAARGWIGLHFAGIALMLAPLAILPRAGMNESFVLIFIALSSGALLAGTGALFWLARPPDWREWLRGRTTILVCLTVGAALLPTLADTIAPLWYWQILTEATFAVVALMLLALGEVPVGDPAAQIIGTGDFVVAIADSCSGIEGVALITGFMALYAVLFRDTLRMGRFWGVVWPVALGLSWLLNALRITVLIEIGAHVSPELAVNGFHSFAGWLFFTVLALAVLIATSRIGWLQRAAPRDNDRPLAEDDHAARIVPFIVFMLSGVAAQTFWQVPAMAYPWQAAAMLAALWWARRPLLRLFSRPAPLAVVAGAAIGMVWVLAAGPPKAAAAPVALGAGAFALWAAIRLLGTTLLVPIIEELFFRGYVQARIDDGTALRRFASVALSAALFGALHGRWLLAGAAGVVFSLLYLRRGRMADAIAAHATANAVIAGAALWYGDWSLI